MSGDVMPEREARLAEVRKRIEEDTGTGLVWREDALLLLSELAAVEARLEEGRVDSERFVSAMTRGVVESAVERAEAAEARVVELQEALRRVAHAETMDEAQAILDAALASGGDTEGIGTKPTASR